MAILAGQIIRAADLVPTEWQPVEFLNGWRNFGSGWSDAQFRKHPLTNIVEVKGTIQGGTTTNDVVVFTLPTGYRPIANVAFAVGHVSTPVTSSVEARFYSNGNVTLHGAGSLNAPVVVIDGVQLYVGD